MNGRFVLTASGDQFLFNLEAGNDSASADERTRTGNAAPNG